MQHYRQAPLHYINIQAADYGLKHMGHMGYFRQGAEQLWDEVLTKFSELHQLKYAA
jgi:Predicted alpha/beta hydrolase